MKNKIKVLLALLVMGFSTSCFEDRDDNGIFASEINDFVWKGMNLYYLYKDNVPDLANDRFTTDQAYGDYLNSFESPENLFYDVLYNRQSVDRFSWIVDDYIELENFFDGITYHNGMEWGFGIVPGTTSDVFGVIRYVLPDSNADDAGLKRGDLFLTVDGTPLFYNSNSDTNVGLLYGSSYSIGMADIDNNGTPQSDDDTIISNGTEVLLVEEIYEENPVHITDVLNVSGENVGYLMYNGFTGKYDDEIVQAFETLATNNVTDLVLDLRYNPGGGVHISILVASMITGQFTGQVHSTEQWNSEIQEFFESTSEGQEGLINRFVDNFEGASLVGLGLDRVYILTSGSSASASEMVINTLRPYIDVVQIGTTTAGKYQGSRTLYDSENFSREGANPNHTYAMQPLVVKYQNKNGVTDYFDGLDPDIELKESASTFGVLGDVNEPLLARAIQEIEASRSSFYIDPNPIELIGSRDDWIPFAKEMYTNKPIPNIVKNKLKINQ